MDCCCCHWVTPRGFQFLPLAAIEFHYLTTAIEKKKEEKKKEEKKKVLSAKFVTTKQNNKTAKKKNEKKKERETMFALSLSLALNMHTLKAIYGFHNIYIIYIWLKPKIYNMCNTYFLHGFTGDRLQAWSDDFCYFCYFCYYYNYYNYYFDFIQCSHNSIEASEHIFFLKEK